MTESVVPPPGPLLASGRAADVYDVGDGQVLRRYRGSGQNTAYETRVMRFVAEQGIRVPAVFELGPHHLPDRDILMERIDGITMLDADCGQRMTTWAPQVSWQDIWERPFVSYGTPLVIACCE